MSEKKKEIHKKKLEHWKVIALYLAVYDLMAVNLSYFLALWIRFDCKYSQISADYLRSFLVFAPFYSVFCIFVFWRLRLYNSIWRFASYSELVRVTLANIITGLVHTVGITAFVIRMPISYYMMGIGLQFFFTLLIRFSYRFVLMEKGRRAKNGEDGYTGNVMVIGAGAAGQAILKELNSAKETHLRPCCIIDDNSNKHGRYMEGVPIVGGRDDILVSAEKYHIDEIFLAMPTAGAESKRDILNICKETGCKLKMLPGIYQLVNGEASLSSMKDVAVEDLLGRDPIKVDLKEIFDYLKGKTILVTGGGGSIGSELCRQIAAHEPGHLVIFDVYENNAYEIEQELKASYPRLCMTVLIGSVRDSRRIEQVFDTYRPDVVYHAAAHKHVPLMEASPCEAIKNNVIGTYKTACAALKYGCGRFVLISTDKAVNPTNVMGASKRLCEMVIQTLDMVSREGKDSLLPVLNGHNVDNIDNPHPALRSGETAVSAGLPVGDAAKDIKETENMQTTSRRTEFVAVRFGNVLGSNGSVIPLFKKQIQERRAVTVTHPDIIRYFMTIPEAVGLVLQAGVYARGGEIFVLDMGEPVKIDTLARNLIKLSGYKPDVDIPVVYTGLRPGEKLYEEKLMAEEGMKTTPNRLIYIGKPIAFDMEKFLGRLEELAEASYNNDADIRELIFELVPTYHPPVEEKEQQEAVYRELLNEAAATSVG